MEGFFLKISSTIRMFYLFVAGAPAAAGVCGAPWGDERPRGAGPGGIWESPAEGAHWHFGTLHWGLGHGPWWQTEWPADRQTCVHQPGFALCPGPPEASLWDINAPLPLSPRGAQPGFRELAGTYTGGPLLHNSHHSGPSVQAYVEQQPRLAQTSSRWGVIQAVCIRHPRRTSHRPETPTPEPSCPIPVASFLTFSALQAFLFHQAKTRNAGQESRARAGRLPARGTHRRGGFALLAPQIDRLSSARPSGQESVHCTRLWHRGGEYFHSRWALSAAREGPRHTKESGDAHLPQSQLQVIMDINLRVEHFRGLLDSIFCPCVGE